MELARKLNPICALNSSIWSDRSSRTHRVEPNQWSWMDSFFLHLQPKILAFSELSWQKGPRCWLDTNRVFREKQHFFAQSNSGCAAALNKIAAGISPSWLIVGFVPLGDCMAFKFTCSIYLNFAITLDLRVLWNYNKSLCRLYTDAGSTYHLYATIFKPSFLILICKLISNVVHISLIRVAWIPYDLPSWSWLIMVTSVNITIKRNATLDWYHRL